MAESPSTCQSCRKFVSGDFSKLTVFKDRYLCSTCLQQAKAVEVQAEQTKQATTEASRQYYCTACKSYSPEAAKRGNGWIEFVLWMAALVPGVIYSIWRRSGDKRVCRKCRSPTIIAASDGTHVRCPDCAELVLSEARKCKHCGCTLTPARSAA